jgi:hypothetical protein
MKYKEFTKYPIVKECSDSSEQKFEKNVQNVKFFFFKSKNITSFKIIIL